MDLSERASDCDLSAIRRVEGPTPGWQVRVFRASGGETKFFADRYLGGPEQSLQAALKERAKLQARYPKLSPHERAQRPRKSSPSAKAARVRRVTKHKQTRAGVRSYAYWVAIWSDDSGPRTRWFSIQRLGEDKARQLAEQACLAGERDKIKGVRLVKRKVRVKKGFCERRFWVASWTSPETGRECTRSFSLAKYGAQKALELALSKRREEIEKLRGG